MSGAEKALAIAQVAHQGQKDKGGVPYIQHPLAVASKMDTEDEVIVALLHDVVEDSEYTFEDLEKEGFSDHVIDALKLLTHDPKVPYMDYIRNLKDNKLARKVKLADLNHNSQLSRLNHEPTMADLKRLKKYEAAKQLLNENIDHPKEV